MLEGDDTLMCIQLTKDTVSALLKPMPKGFSVGVVQWIH